jgi:hypothetical protein
MELKGQEGLREKRTIKREGNWWGGKERYRRVGMNK